jgi:hypothetical protein
MRSATPSARASAISGRCRRRRGGPRSAQIVAADDHSPASLREAELARGLVAESLGKSETTLAAYRRVVTPPLANATLVNRRG